MSDNKKQISLLITALLLTALYFSLDRLFRHFWCDEALTAIEFLSFSNPWDIYNAYAIPNNHIVFTILLSGWMNIGEFFFDFYDFSFRLFTILIAFICLIVLFNNWKKECGLAPAFLTLLCFTASIPFEIYSTAVRGYMLSFLFVALSFIFCRKWIRKGLKKHAVVFFVFSLLAVGTIPSNIIAVMCGVYYFIPEFSFRELFKKRFITAVLIPPISLLVFYLPIFSKFMKNLSLKEGWSDPVSAAICLYSGYSVPMLPLILLALYGLFVFPGNPKQRKKVFFRCSIFLIPLLFLFILRPAPFPRVFFSLFPLWLYMGALGIRQALIAIKMKNPKAVRYVTVTMALFIAAWAFGQRTFNENLSDMIVPHNSLDDYMSPYYMKKTYDPLLTAKTVEKFIKERGPAYVYVDFSADPYALRFNGRFTKVPMETWMFDNPKRKAPDPGDCPNILLIVTNEDELEAAKKRFKINKTFLLKDAGFQKIYMKLN